jgi:cellulose synthase/poly-beta-1,6-N-acetylglucosamine synthase-like glycosyltransferase
VSVVLAARNAEQTLDSCVRSLLDLDYPRERLEIVAVDNGSTDATARILAGFGRQLKVVREQRRGPAAARNAGIRVADGEVIALIDADSTSDSGWLRHLVPSLARPRVGIAGGRILASRPANRIELYGETIHDAFSAVHVWKPPYVVTGNWAARRALLDQVGMFDERLLRGSDVDLSFRVVQAGYVLAHCPEAVVYHRNERTLAGLFREGFVHGFHGVALARRHAGLIAEQHVQRRRGRPRGLCDRVFRTGKRLGRATGEIWWSRR